ncbi:AAA ATPase [Rhizopus stolonifer]|uniref:AAA ATPase n=1 Tax=Rhizopus stolonifer TaxID=4846 RepID=A0A367KSU5_RHIST|nr:AAA ATPase [Rhizopus stolonifer]
MTTPRNKRKADDNVSNDSSMKKRTTVESKAVDQEKVEINRTYLKTNNTNNIYQNAKSVFRRTAVPSRLVGRGEERERMSEFYRDHVLSNRSGSLYISGMPGTGKTAMLTEVMRTMQDDIDQLDYEVKTTVVNCMSIKEPKQIYIKLVEAWKSTDTATKSDVVQQAHELLMEESVLRVVVLDEIDSLITREQEVLYKLFEWVFLSNSRLVLIGIANALDLTDRVLPRLRAKNCEPQLLNFNPYKVPEISTIIKDRLYSLVETPSNETPIPIFQPAAIEFCSRKIAASMGDLRTALDVCRQAIEVAEMEQKKLIKAGNASIPELKVTLKHVMNVMNSAFGSPTVQKLKQLNLQQKIVLGVFYVMIKTKKDITLGKFRQEYSVLCSDTKTAVSSVSKSELNDLLSMLESSSLINLGKRHGNIKNDRISPCFE